MKTIKTIIHSLLVTTCLVLIGSTYAIVMPSHGIALSNQNLVVLTNKERASKGLSALAWNSALSSSAYMKAKDICAKGYWAHTAPDGTTAWTLMQQAGYSYTAAGENLARGYATDEATMSAWMASPEHRANILGAAYHDVGIASMTCSLKGSSTTVVVSHFGASSPHTTVTKVQTTVRKVQPARQVTTRVHTAAPKAVKKVTKAAPTTVKPAASHPAQQSFLMKSLLQFLKVQNKNMLTYFDKTFLLQA